MTFLPTSLILTWLKAWAASQGRKKLEKLALDDRYDFRTDVPLSRKSLFAWTETSLLTPEERKLSGRRLAFDISVAGKTFYIYYRICRTP